MPSVCLYLKAHQPYRVKRFRVFDIGKDRDYFNDDTDTDVNNARIIRKVVEKSYRPTNAMLLKLLKKYPDFRVSFSLTGVLLEQLEEYAPDVIEQFQNLVSTGCVEILAETYHHTLSFFYSVQEFENQVSLHERKVQGLFGVTPRVFSNTELAYNNNLARWAERKGYEGVIAEGWDAVLNDRSPNFVYRPIGTKNISVLLKNYRLSDDIAFRFSEKSWSEWPITVEKFGQWVSVLNGHAETVNLFMDYETFGEHQWKETGIFDFLEKLPAEILKNPDNNFMTPSEVIRAYKPVDEISVPDVLTWADTDRDLTAWTGNKMQRSALQDVYALENELKMLEDSALLDTWRRMQTSDHFYYMCTKWFADGDVHAYFSPYDSPYEAFISYMNALRDLKIRIKQMHVNYKKLEELNHTHEALSSQVVQSEDIGIERLKDRLYKFVN